MKWLVGLLSALAAIGLFLLMGIVFCDVIARNFLGRPLQGAGEVARFVLGVSVFLALPMASLRSSHISVDLLTAINSRLLRSVEVYLGLVLTTVFFGVLGWQLYNQSVKAAAYNDVTFILNIPVAPFALIMAVLSVVSALALFAGLKDLLIKSQSSDHIGSSQL